ncbi:MAG: hypothetical protein V7K62_30685 [Nostoc sp.]
MSTTGCGARSPSRLPLGLALSEAMPKALRCAIGDALNYNGELYRLESGFN